MNFDFNIIDSIFAKLKRFKIKPQILKPFLTDLVCCMIGLRDAYLVDGISVEVATVHEISTIAYSTLLACGKKKKNSNNSGSVIMWGEEFHRWVDGDSSNTNTNHTHSLFVSKVLLVQLNNFDIIVCNLTEFHRKYCSLHTMGIRNVVIDVSQHDDAQSADPAFCGRLCSASDERVLADQLLCLFQPVWTAIETAINSPVEHIVVYAIYGNCGDMGGCDLSPELALTVDQAAGAQAVISVPNTVLSPDLSFAFLAGWLLNYSCIYHFSPKLNVSAAGGDDCAGTVACLCNQPLTKYTISFSPRSVGSARVKPVILMEFTAPDGLLSSEYHYHSDCGGDSGCGMSVAAVIESFTAQHITRIGCLSENLGNPEVLCCKTHVCESCIVL